MLKPVKLLIYMELLLILFTDLQILFYIQIVEHDFKM
jgi:hypothetical protein